MGSAWPLRLSAIHTGLGQGSSKGLGAAQGSMEQDCTPHHAPANQLHRHCPSSPLGPLPLGFSLKQSLGAADARVGSIRFRLHFGAKSAAQAKKDMLQ